MATRTLHHLPLDRIEAEARQVHLGRALLTFLVGIFWALGWLAGKVSLAVRVAVAATREGWRDARRPFLEAEAEVTGGRRSA